jgi:soluble lytic murein transglycosylase
MFRWISAPIRAVSVLAVLLLLPGGAAAQDVMSHVRADRWAEAEAAVALHPDPVARKLVTWMRLMAPGAGRADEIGAFASANPDWPHAAVLARRRDEALALEEDAALARAECRRTTPTLTAALLRCADALAGTGDGAAVMLRAAWERAPGDAAWETRFIARWASVLTREDHLRRFEHLAWSDPVAARRQADRLDRGHQMLIEARLALRRDDPAAPGLVRALPAAQRGDAALMLDHARFLRRAARDNEAAAFWRANGAAAERAAPAARRAEFWAERNLMTRRRIRQGDDAGAYAIAAGHAQTAGEQRLDAEFLAGFIALRRLGDAARAHGHFEALADASRSAITQGRAQYWLGRAASATQARDEAFRRAAVWTSTYYGQIAAHKLSADARAFAARVAASRDPQADAARALDLAGRELARAAALLVAWGEPRRAAPFLLQLYEVSPDAPDRALAARLAGGLGLTETAVAIARRAGRDGTMLPETGWPTTLPQPVSVPVEAVEKAITLAIIRQESNFDSLAVSPAGARGLMQLMPGTAANVARGLGVAAPLRALTADPELNIRLGTTYLRGLMDQFDANIAMAAAGYNAGPRRVVEWIDLNGDPRAQGVDIIDWIELIPFSETRNYVQRVVENTVIYRARMGDSGAAIAHPLAPWLR